LASLKLVQARSLEGFQDLISDWLWEVDRGNILTYSNGRLENALRNPEGSFTGENIIGLFERLMHDVGVTDIPAFDALAGYLAGNEEFSLPPLPIPSTDRACSQIHIRAIPVFDDKNNLTGFRGSGCFSEESESRVEDAARLKTLMMAVNNTPNGIIITDEKGIIRYANPGFTKITGFSRAESLGKTPKILSSGHTSDSAYSDFWNTIKQGKSWQGTVYNKRKNGEFFWCQETVTPVVQRNGRITNYIAIQQDVTAEVKAQEELKCSKERFKGFTEAASDWYWETDNQLRFSYISDSACEYAGMDLNDMLGMTRAELVTQAEDQEFWREHLEDLDNKRSFKDFTYTFVRKDGEHRRWQISGKPFYAEDGMFLGYRGVGKDITLSTELEAQLQQSQKMEVVGHLTGGIAHDFNNLLGIMMGNAELLKEQLLSEGLPGDDKIANIIYAAKRGSSITNQLLVFSRKEALKPHVIRPKRQLDQMMDMLRSSMGSGVELRLESEPDLWSCYVDPDQFVNSVLNLCINARDAMDQKGVLKVLLRNETLNAPDPGLEIPPGDYVVLTVKDCGHGISKRDLTKVFEPFFSTKERGKGTGLGLSMVYGFAKKSGGAIWIESVFGIGTDVHLYLPRHNIEPSVSKVAPNE